MSTFVGVLRSSIPKYELIYPTASNMLDVPNFFWDSEPTLHPLYFGVREYLEIKPRIQVLNERCRVFLDLAEILSDSIADNKMSSKSPLSFHYLPQLLNNNARINVHNHRPNRHLNLRHLFRSLPPLRNTEHTRRRLRYKESGSTFL